MLGVIHSDWPEETSCLSLDTGTITGVSCGCQVWDVLPPTAPDPELRMLSPERTVHGLQA